MNDEFLIVVGKLPLSLDIVLVLWLSFHTKVGRIHRICQGMGAIKVCVFRVLLEDRHIWIKLI